MKNKPACKAKGDGDSSPETETLVDEESSDSADQRVNEEAWVEYAWQFTIL
jgi:hypothetical protein